MTNEEKAVNATYFSIIGNTSLAIVKGLAGYFGNSYALVADAIESTSDIFASFLVLFELNILTGLRIKITHTDMDVQNRW